MFVCDHGEVQPNRSGPCTEEHLATTRLLFDMRDFTSVSTLLYAGHCVRTSHGGASTGRVEREACHDSVVQIYSRITHLAKQFL